MGIPGVLLKQSQTTGSFAPDGEAMFHFLNSMTGLWRIKATLFVVAALVTGCAAQSAEPPRAAEENTEAGVRAPGDTWRPLMDRLVADGFEKETVETLFSRVEGDVSLSPMGTKAYELYRIRFLRPKTRPRVKPEKKPQTPPIYKGVVTEENIKKAKNFMEEHKEWLDNAHERFGVSPEVTVGLLLVETRLGTYLGKAMAFETLASMSASRELEPLLPYLKGNEPTEEESAWLEEAIGKKADWAYSELKALMEYSLENGVDPLIMPCSVYGAVGVCQFMPSNIKAYGRDGNGNGRVDLFSVPDAVASVGNYLKEHGWKEGLDRAGKVRVLKKYNNSTIYANTILALADKLGPDKRESNGKSEDTSAQRRKNRANKPSAGKSKAQPGSAKAKTKVKAKSNVGAAR